MRFTFILLLWTSAALHPAFAQETQQGQSTDQKQRRFSIGLNYTFMQADMKLYSRTGHALWQGLDYGTDTLTSEDIDDINSIARFSSNNNALCVEAGMVFLDKPESHWHIDGKIMLGIAKTTYQTYDKARETTDLKVTSTFSRPVLGLEFLFRCVFNRNWGVSLSPSFIYSMGSATNITDNLDPPAANITISRKEKSTTIYSHIAMMANFSFKGFTVSAGPGFYFGYNSRIYTVNGTNLNTGSEYYNETSSVYFNRSFIDGCINLEWRIISQLDLNLYCGIGADILVHPGIRFLF